MIKDFLHRFLYVRAETFLMVLVAETWVEVEAAPAVMDVVERVVADPLAELDIIECRGVPPGFAIVQV